MKRTALLVALSLSLSLLVPSLVEGQSPQVAPSGACGKNIRIVAYKRNGASQPAFIEPGFYCQLELSPDGARLVIERKNGASGVSLDAQPYDLWLADLESGTFKRWTVASMSHRDPVWSPDSRTVVFRTQLDQKYELRRIGVGSPNEITLLSAAVINFPDDWAQTKDGSFLLYHTDKPDTVAVLSLGGNSQASVLLNTQGTRNALRVSPNGRWIAYGVNDGGTSEVYLAAFPSFEGKRQISHGGGVQVRWRNDGRELYYLSRDAKMMVQSIDPESGREIGTPRTLFETSAAPVFVAYAYSVSPDGETFYVAEPEVADAK